MQSRKVFFIGLHLVGAGYLKALFEASGYKVAAWEGGRLAGDICYTARTGAPPLRDFAGHDVFVDLSDHSKIERLPLNGHAEFAHLRRFFPDAYFVLNTRPVEHWLAQRWKHGGGAFRKRQAIQWKTAEENLPDMWRAEWSKHLNDCRSFFSDDIRFLELAMDKHAGQRLADFLQNDFALTPEPDLARYLPKAGALPVHLQPGRKKTWRRARRLWSAKRQDFAARDRQFCQQIVDFATKDDPTIPRVLGSDSCSRLFANWDGGVRVSGRDGAALPIDVTPERAPFVFMRKPHTFFKEYRAEAVLNELWSVDARKGAQVDFDDARRFGTVKTGALKKPILAFNRRQGATGLNLWPLPGYHTPGQDTYLTAACRDKTPFAAKRDQVVWRGNTSGVMHRDFAPDATELRPAGQIAIDLSNGGDEDRLLAELNAVPRGRMMNNFHGHPDCDFGWVMGKITADQELHPVLHRQVAAKLSVQEFYRYRYILSISGYDTASNFLMAADSNSVVLREEDGWEVFYTGQFQPWVHYIPLVIGADDLLEKLDWARSHPGECQAMSRAAQAVCRRIANPGNRDEYLRGILEVYEARM